MNFSLRRLAWLFLFTAAAGTASFAASPHRAAPWASLFNGRDLAGWTLEAQPADRERKVVSVHDGAIHVHIRAPDDLCQDHVWLTTQAEYSDFVLRLKFQCVRGDPGNSGIQIRSRLDAVYGMQGPQLDLNPAGPWRTGMLYDMTAGVTRFLKPPGQTSEIKAPMAVPGLIHHFADEGSGWNEMEITAIGPHLTCVLNGVTVMDFVDTEKLLQDDNHRKYRVGVKGFIAIQIHSGRPLDVKFKDLEIQDLAAAPTREP